MRGLGFGKARVDIFVIVVGGIKADMGWSWWLRFWTMRW